MAVFTKVHGVASKKILMLSEGQILEGATCLKWKGFFRYRQVPLNASTLLEVKLKILGNGVFFR
jgi:hypothetical protein